ncbi:MAG: UDP-N-acetylglucosamine 2-epimerase (non-hydrolyzing) [Thermoproteota archaeon]|nr:MAG: UDP-N-acetylglucosamine 2-epimerase (non-hydrolyzing) [Candidatus Korarchaeota archaeon]
MRLLVFVGTRPEIVKTAPILEKLQVHPEVEWALCYTGQHYDRMLRDAILSDFNLGEPDFDLEVGSGSHASQTGEAMVKAEQVILTFKPDLCLAQGDTNSVLAVALASVKLGVPFAHVEAGLRSFDMTMPEEVNRRIVDSISSLNFAPTERAALNLLYEGADPSSVHVTGNTGIDALMKYLERAKRESDVIEDLGLSEDMALATLTVHRPSNTTKHALERILAAIEQLDELIFLFPVHPRTYEALKAHGLWKRAKKIEHLYLLKPLRYIDFLRVLQASMLALTDSGGVQEEAAAIGIPCITLRKNTERPETVELGTNILVGCDTERIVDAVKRVLYDPEIREKAREQPCPFGDGRAGERIVEILLSKSGSIELKSPSFYRSGAPLFELIEVKTELPVTVDEIQEMGAIVTLIYTQEGRPEIPHISRELKAGEKVRVLGEADAIEAVRRRLT